MIALILCLPLCFGCKDNDLDLSGETYSLDKIADNPDYQSMPLVGTKWKLVGFVDGKKNKITVVEQEVEEVPDWESKYYTLVFEENGILGGYTSVNRA